MRKKIYIAGKVSGEDQLECAMKFETMQKQIEALGFEAVNPLKVVGTWDITWNEAMIKCLKALLDCQAMVLLEDWQESKGAKIEVKLARYLEKPICVYTPDGLQIKFM